MHVRLIALLTLLLALVAAPARAYTPPAMTGYVTDAAGKLTESQRLALDQKLQAYDHRTGNQVAVFIAKSLEGESIDVVGADTGRAWHVGVKGKDNGVLLVIAPNERKAEIATGKGVEGALPDLRTNDIIHQKLQPQLRPGHEDWNAAVEDTTDAIMAALDAGGVAGGGASSAGTPPPKPAGLGDVLFALIFFGLMLGVPILFVILFIRGLVSAFSSNGRSASRGWASGSSWSNDSSWSSSSSSDWSSSGSSWSSSDSSFGGSSGDIGGGGDFGGGGSSDSF